LPSDDDFLTKGSLDWMTSNSRGAALLMSGRRADVPEAPPKQIPPKRNVAKRQPHPNPERLMCTTWVNGQQVADAIGCSDRYVRELAESGLITKGGRKRSPMYLSSSVLGFLGRK
jgi:hypothetical protein